MPHLLPVVGSFHKALDLFQVLAESTVAEILVGVDEAVDGPRLHSGDVLGNVVRWETPARITGTSTASKNSMVKFAMFRFAIRDLTLLAHPSICAWTAASTVLPSDSKGTAKSS